MKSAPYVRRVFERVFGRTKNESKSEAVVRRGDDEYERRIQAITIKGSPEQIKSARFRHAREVELFTELLKESRAVKEGMLEELVSMVYYTRRFDVYIDVFKSFKDGNILSLADKRRLGLDTRKKYWDKLLNYFDPSTFATTDPKDLIDLSHRKAIAISFREANVRKASSLGCTHVRLMPLKGCESLFSNSKFSLDSLPNLPHHGCRVRVCLCDYLPILPGISESLQ